MKNAVSRATNPKDVRSWLLTPAAAKDLAVISRSLMSGERLANVLYLCIQKTPDLAECTPASLMAATKTLVNMGCEPDGIHGYLVPRNIKAKDGSWLKTCTPIPSARGLLRMARSNGISNIMIGTVREKDQFSWGIKYGSFDFSHVSDWDDSSPIIGFYCAWRDSSCNLHGERMSLAAVEAIRDRSDAYKRYKEKGSTCPWVTDFEQMALKTVIKRAAKQWDLPYDVSAAMAEADTAEFGSDEDHMRNVTRAKMQLPEQTQEDPTPSANTLFPSAEDAPSPVVD